MPPAATMFFQNRALRVRFRSDFAPSLLSNFGPVSPNHPLIDPQYNFPNAGLPVCINSPPTSVHDAQDRRPARCNPMPSYPLDAPNRNRKAWGKRDLGKRLRGKRATTQVLPEVMSSNLDGIAPHRCMVNAAQSAHSTASKIKRRAHPPDVTHWQTQATGRQTALAPTHMAPERPTANVSADGRPRPAEARSTRQIRPNMDAWDCTIVRFFGPDPGEEANLEGQGQLREIRSGRLSRCTGDHLKSMQHKGTYRGTCSVRGSSPARRSNKAQGWPDTAKVWPKSAGTWPKSAACSAEGMPSLVGIGPILPTSAQGWSMLAQIPLPRCRAFEVLSYILIPNEDQTPCIRC